MDIYSFLLFPFTLLQSFGSKPSTLTLHIHTHTVSHHWPSHATVLANLFLPFDHSDTNVRDGCLHLCQTSGLTLASWPQQRSRHTAVNRALSSYCLLTYMAFYGSGKWQQYESVHTSWLEPSVSTLSNFPRNLGHVFLEIGHISPTELLIVCMKIPLLAMWFSSRQERSVLWQFLWSSE